MASEIFGTKFGKNKYEEVYSPAGYTAYIFNCAKHCAYRVFQKIVAPPLKLFGIFLLQLSFFA